MPIPSSVQRPNAFVIQPYRAEMAHAACTYQVPLTCGGEIVRRIKAARVAKSKNVGNLTQRNRRFRTGRRFDHLSFQRYEFLMRSGCVNKGMAVWNNTQKPLLGADQEWLVKCHWHIVSLRRMFLAGTGTFGNCE